MVPYFSVFIAIWIYLRHYINLRILFATLTSFATVGPYVLDWDAQQYKCWISQIITFTLLAVLQSINLFWLFYIVRIAYNIVFRSAVADVRSDVEEGEEREERKVRGREGVGLGEGRGDEAAVVEVDGEVGGVEVGGAGGDGDASVEGLDEYVDVGREEKKDR